MNQMSDLPITCQIDFSKSQIIEMYNTLPNLLSTQAIQVSTEEERPISSQKEGIVLSQKPRGIYWIIPAEHETYWLFPRGSLIVNGFILRSVQSIFNCSGLETKDNLETKDTREFTLTEPARVVPLDSSNSKVEWKLVEKGTLNFGKQTELSKVRSQLEAMKNERDRLVQEKRELTQERDRFQRQVAELGYERYQAMKTELMTRDEFQAALQPLKQEIQEQKVAQNRLTDEIREWVHDTREQVHEIHNCQKELSLKLDTFQRTGSLAICLTSKERSND